MRHAIILIACATFSLPARGEEPIPWPEHPRPDFQRPAWLNLNGKWRFAFDPKDVGVTEEWFEPGKNSFDRQIVVPFPWESKLSGIGDTKYTGVAWYAREIEIPTGKDWDGKDIWLIVGACDFEAKVWINGKEAGAYISGYLPFELNLAPFARPGEKAHIVIRGVDRTDPQQPTGKQIGWYTHTGGIWQTVYLEPRGKIFISAIQATADIKNGTVHFAIGANGLAKLRASSPDARFEPGLVSVDGQAMSRRTTAHVTNPQRWTPDSPTLYPARFELLNPDGTVIDRVHTYFGLREISVAKAPGRDYQYICLNGEPIYLRGALHQSFHPDGIYQYPDDATMRGDYELCKKIGINMLRIHIKLPVPRELYWADKLGVLVMQDMPCFWKYTKQSQDWYGQMLRGAIARDFNHPSIFAWVDFNETWGIEDGGYSPEHQKWVEAMYRLTKQLDPTRLVEDNSPCKYDHTTTDVNSWHFYISDYEQAKKHIADVVEKTHPGSPFNFAQGYKQGNQPLINSEYGGISAGLGDQDISWCFKYLTNELRKHDRICGYIYTELSDIEWEHNGFVNYDRSPKEYGYDYWHHEMELKDLNSPDFVVIDAPPMIRLKRGETRQVPIKISHWSNRYARDLRLRWMTYWPGAQPSDDQSNWYARAAHWKPFQVIDQGPITISTKGSHGAVGALLVQLVNGDSVLMNNYVNVEVIDSPPFVYTLSGDRLALKFNPGDYAQATFDVLRPAITSVQANWVSGQGAGYVEYELRIPDEVSLDHVEKVQVVAEMASSAGPAKLDWPARRNPNDHPQTDVRKWPTDVRIAINGEEVAQRTLPDDPADARGALSHEHGAQGGYGFVVPTSIPTAGRLRRIIDASRPDHIMRIRFSVPTEAKNVGGLTLYGQGEGLYGAAPYLVLTQAKGHRPESIRSDQNPAIHRAVQRLQIVVPTAEVGGHEWSLTTSQPADDWPSLGFDSSAWRKSKGGFGSRGTPNAIIGTRWNTSDIWLRTVFELENPNGVESGMWRIYHDEDVQIDLNGARVLQKKGAVDHYTQEPLSPEAIRALRPGKNLIAVHCHQIGGGQNIDVGLTLIRKPVSK